MVSCFVLNIEKSEGNCTRSVRLFKPLVASFSLRYQTVFEKKMMEDFNNILHP